MRPLWAGLVDQDRVDPCQPVSAVGSERLSCKGAGDGPQCCRGLEDRYRFVRGPAIRWTIEIPRPRAAEPGGMEHIAHEDLQGATSRSPERIQGLSRGHGWS